MKWPWNAAPPPTPPPEPTDGAALRALEDRIRAVEARVTDMTATTGLLRVEWAEVLDKINRWASRQSGRLARQAKENIDAASQDAPGGANPEPGGTGRQLSKAELRRLVGQRFNHSNGG